MIEGRGRLPPLTAPGRAEIVRDYLALLAGSNSPLLAAADTTGQLREQIHAVLDMVGDLPGDEDAPEKAPAAAPEEAPAAAGKAVLPGLRAAGGATGDVNIRIGVSRAAAGARPADSLLAAGYIFQAALPVTAREWAAAGIPESERTAALALNWAISWRMSHAAAAYVEYLLDRVHRANDEERRRLARELHDRAAHAVGVGMQYLELSLLHVPDDEARGDLAKTRRMLEEAVDTIRVMSADLRDPLDAQGLGQAVRSYLEANASHVDTRVLVEGDVDVLPTAYAREFYLALREAVRNALIHSGSATLDVSLSALGGLITAVVADTGCGFELDRIRQAHSQDRVGLTSMQERIELLGGVLTTHSVLGSGTVVRFQVPVPGSLP